MRQNDCKTSIGTYILHFKFKCLNELYKGEKLGNFVPAFIKKFNSYCLNDRFKNDQLI